MSPDFRTIRSWDGSQDRAFEELCYQLRDTVPDGAELIKTGDPDGGVEWYVRHPDGSESGWQAKFSFDTDTLLKLMEASLKTVVEKRPDCRRLTYCIPYDLPDAPGGSERKSAREKFEDRRASWTQRIEGADRVQIDLISAGDLLDRLAAHPNQRGISWFFWNGEVFAADWLQRRLDVTIKAAGERYSPALHLELPVAFALEGLAQSDEFWRRYRERRAAVLEAASRVGRDDLTGLGVSDAVTDALALVRGWDTDVPRVYEPPARLARDESLSISMRLRDATERAFPDYPRREDKVGSGQHTELDSRRRSLYGDLARLRSAVVDFIGFLRTGAAVAAQRGALLLTGEAGQGKTHLFCDAGQRALHRDSPAIVLLGGRLTGRRFWSDCAEVLQLPQVGGEVLRGGMRAAAEASGRPFLLLVDALNEAQDPAAWRDELPGVLAELEEDPWISLAISVRSTFLPVVLPGDELADALATVEHRGFRGREMEASERFFDAYALEQPRVPLLTPEFANPLFLKLYCEGLRGLEFTSVTAGETHVTTVFARYLEWKAKRITGILELDPDDEPVARAVDRFADELASRGAEQLPRAEAAELVNGFAPGRDRWPRTMFGQLLSEGVLADDVAWAQDRDELVPIVRFVYQRFSDYRIAGSMLDGHNDAVSVRDALVAGSPLRRSVLAAPAGWIEALSVLLPERFGVELLDAAHWRLSRYRRHQWDRALVHSIVSRRTDAIGGRALARLRAAEEKSSALTDEIHDAVLTVAPLPGHPLNADHLHDVLMRSVMPDRDASWGVAIYFALDNEGPLDRLVRWAARGPHDHSPDEVHRLAGTALTWTFSSPNRFLRDVATKALRQLLDTRLSVLEQIVRQFAGCDDPYVLERLALVAHGSLLTGGGEDPQGALRLARACDEILLDQNRVPNILTRDSVRGCLEWAHHRGLIESAEYQAACPPYHSDPPARPRTKKQLEKAYDWHKRDREGNYVGSPYGSLFGSLFAMGDFGRYVVQSRLEEFTNIPLDRRIPRPRLAQVDQRRFDAFVSSLPEEVRTLTNPEAIRDALTASQQEELWAILHPPQRRSIARTRRYPAELAQRWIFDRVLELGWTPERFGEFERTHLRGGAGRSAHKPERFGKKYQWLAWHELLARITDNFHMRADWNDEPQTFHGPWQFYVRELDPTLPPPPRTRDEDGDIRVDATFADDPPQPWWDPGGPRLRATDPIEDDWAVATDDLPTLEQLVAHQGPDGATWIVLNARFRWEEEDRDTDRWDEGRPRRDLWSYIQSWLVDAGDLAAVLAHLRDRTFMGRWMPEPGEMINAAYLGELPWSASTRDLAPEWQHLRSRQGDDTPYQVLPAWTQYLWEGSGRDCSLEDSVSVLLPTRTLLEQNDLSWVPGSRSWCTLDGAVVAQCVSRQGHDALLVSEPWLRSALKRAGTALVLGWLGEKMLLSGGLSPDLRGDWIEMNGLGSIDDHGFQTLGATLRRVSQRSDGGS